MDMRVRACPEIFMLMPMHHSKHISSQTAMMEGIGWTIIRKPTFPPCEGHVKIQEQAHTTTITGQHSRTDSIFSNPVVSRSG